VTTSSASLPLAGLRILAPTQLGAGPFGLMFLADLGAEVVKIENPRRAVTKRARCRRSTIPLPTTGSTSRR
jgi:crotonobetainyl-CoA:carnitine CoA-transferase CaiB-like acyl-CoA transferase